MKDGPAHPKRRRLLRLGVAAGVVGAVYGGTGLLRRLTEEELRFTDMKDPPGFRQIDGGPVSGGSLVLLGIEAGEAAEEHETISDGDLCQALFGPVPDPAAVQIAYFTDYRCIFCRRVSPMLEEMQRHPDVQVTWHDLPLLGEASRRAARAAVAARAQDAYGEFHRRLMGSPVVPNPAYLRRLAEDAGIDPDRLMRDVGAARTTVQLQATAALARRFGFIGTPALVVGRTAVLGGVDQRLLERLIAIEKTALMSSPCTKP